MRTGAPSRPARALSELSLAQVESKANVAAAALQYLQPHQLQVSPKKRRSSSKTQLIPLQQPSPGPSTQTYDRKALSELLRSSAQTLLFTDGELTKAKAKIEELQAESEAKNRELAAAAALLREKEVTPICTSAATQTDEELPTPAPMSILAHSETQTSPPRRTQTTPKSKAAPGPAPVPSSGSGSDFSSAREFEVIITELIDARLKILELTAALEANRAISVAGQGKGRDAKRPAGKKTRVVS